jgi:hypothetical protein
MKCEQFIEAAVLRALNNIEGVDLSRSPHTPETEKQIFSAIRSRKKGGADGQAKSKGN